MAYSKIFPNITSSLYGDLLRLRNRRRWAFRSIQNINGSDLTTAAKQRAHKCQYY